VNGVEITNPSSIAPGRAPLRDTVYLESPLPAVDPIARRLILQDRLVGGVGFEISGV
jgi:hypothetical protein